MRLRVVKPSGLFWLTPPRKHGEEFDAPEGEAAALLSAGVVVAVASEEIAPVLNLTRNGVPRSYKKKDR